MDISQRHQKILELLRQHNLMTTGRLCAELGVSPATIRNDLRILASGGLIDRVHGGASLHANAPAPSPEPPSSAISPHFREREASQGRQKQAIATRALNYIHDNQCIMLDASTTCLALAQQLTSFTQLLVVTNGIYNVLLLKDMPNVTAAIIGGIATKGSGSCEGTLGVGMLQHFHIDVAFISAFGFSEKEGLTDFNLYEVELKREMIKHSNRVIALIDSSKFGKISVASLMPTSEIDTVLTDADIDTETLQHYQSLGINIEVCPY